MKLPRVALAFATVAAALVPAACGDDGPSKNDDTAADSEIAVDSVDADDSTDTGDSADDGTAAEIDDGSEVADGDETADGDDISDGGDISDGDGQGGDVRVVHAWTTDGGLVQARFSAALDPASAAAAGTFALVASDGATATLGQVLVARATDVQIEVSPPLDDTKTWELRVNGLRALSGATLTTSTPLKTTLYLSMVWHQHQPSYLDPTRDELQGPWVRKHAQKDYYDMTAMLAPFPKVHVNVNLTSSLLTQLERYTTALAAFVDLDAGTVDEAGFLAAHEGHTDPWVDLLLRDTPAPAAMTDLEKSRYYSGTWSMKSIAEPLRSFFPEYAALIAKDPATYTQLDLATLKVWFEVAWMDPDFFAGVDIHLGDKTTRVDLSDVVVKDGDHYRLADKYTTGADALANLEALANRLVADEYKIMAGVFAIHRDLGWNGVDGRVEVLTTPFFHPILPLLFDTDLARAGQPADTLPSPAFAYPEDAALQIAMAVEYYTATFGRAPRGMWPSEGSVAEEIVPALVDNGVSWIATDRQVLDRGMPGASHLQAYKVDADTQVGAAGSDADDLMILFRDTEISDKVGFFYQSQAPLDNVADFMTSVVGKAGRFGEPRRLLSVILDGENAWEWYTQDHDAKRFLTALYTALGDAYDGGTVITVTGSEYIDGNLARDVPAHPVAGLTEYEDLFPGSWIGGRLDTWIGEPEENLGWLYLKTARDQMEAAKALLEPLIGMPASYLTPPVDGTASELAWWRAWRNVLSAEGSDWFWWYGSDQTSAGGNDAPFDDIFRAQLVAAYDELNVALAGEGLPTVEVPAFPPILQPEPVVMTGPYGVVPTLDGQLVPDLSEWVPPGGLFYDGDSSGATADPNDDVARVMYGYNRLQGGRIFVAVDFRQDLSARLGTDFQVVLYTSQGHIADGTLLQEPTAAPAEGVDIPFSSGGPGRRIAIDFSGAAPVVTVQKANDAGVWVDTPATVTIGGPVTGGRLLEIGFLLSDFGMTNGDPLEIAVVTSSGGDARDVAPNTGAQIVFADPTKLVTVIFELDVTGDLEAYANITDPPPPAGAGVPSIVGNQNAFANWTPNSVAMKDDGVAPDAAAGDGIYTFASTFPPGTGLQYKYTIGHSGESWGGTEEYPLTNRGYTVPTDGTRRVRVRDIFADRPDPSGTMAANTTVTVEE